MKNLFGVAAAMVAILFTGRVAAADDVAQPDDAEAARMAKARFSGKRLAVEIIAGEVAGALAAYATYNALCDGESCFGAALAAVGANWVVGAGRAHRRCRSARRPRPRLAARERPRDPERNLSISQGSRGLE